MEAWRLFLAMFDEPAICKPVSTEGASLGIALVDLETRGDLRLLDVHCAQADSIDLSFTGHVAGRDLYRLTLAGLAPVTDVDEAIPITLCLEDRNGMRFSVGVDAACR